MRSEPTPFVETKLAAGTLRASIVHGAVELAWLRKGDRIWSTTRKSLDEGETFAGTLADPIRNERIRQRRPEVA